MGERVGEIYMGQVTSIEDIGAFVKIDTPERVVEGILPAKEMVGGKPPITVGDEIRVEINYPKSIRGGKWFKLAEASDERNCA